MEIANEEEALRMAIKICTMDGFKYPLMAVTWMNDIKKLKRHWNKNMETFLKDFFYNNIVNASMSKRVTGIVYCMTLRMKTWLEHHVGALKLDRDFCLSLLTPDIFTEKGIIDCKKTINQVENRELSIDQRFRLSSWHCLKKQTGALFEALGDDRSIFYNNENPEDIHETDIIKYWAFYIKGDLKLLRKEPEVEVGYPGNPQKIGKPEDLYEPLRSVNIEDIKCDASVNKFMLNSAISSGSETAINYYLDQLGRKIDLLPETLIDIVIHKMKLGIDFVDPSTPVVDDWVVFRCPGYINTSDIWVPSHYLVDTFYSIFSKINDDGDIRRIPPRLKDRIENSSKVRMSKQVQLFGYFMCWPHQDLFLKFVHSCWNHIPYRYFGALLFNIFERIDPAEHSLYYGESKAFDYGKMFTEFWHISPDNFKRYVFEDKNDRRCVFNLGRMLLQKMITTNSFFTKHFTIIRDFLNEATFTEKKNLICSTDGSQLCDFLMEKQNLDSLDELFKMCTESIEEALKFRLSLEAVKPCLEFIKVGNFKEADNILSALGRTDKEVNEIKERIMCCDEGLNLCTDFGFENAENFLNFVQWREWDSLHKIKFVRRALLKKGRSRCTTQAIEAPEKADQFLKLCYSLEEKSPLQINLSIQKLKLDIAKEEGIYFCMNLIVYTSKRLHLTDESPMHFRLVLVDKFIRWCFSPPSFEENENKYRNKETIIAEMQEYRVALFEHSNHEVHYLLLQKMRLEASCTFYSWAGCSSEDIGIFIKNKLFNCDRTAGLFNHAMDLKMNYPEDVTPRHFIVKLLDWCLGDRETLNTFLDKFSQHKNDELINRVINVLSERFIN